MRREEDGSVYEPSKLYDLEAEQQLIGTLMGKVNAFARVRAVMDPEHLADPVHARIYRTMGQLVDEGEPIDAVSLRRQLLTNGELEAAGGAPYLAQLAQAAAMNYLAASDLVARARHIVDFAQRREMLDVLGDAHEATRTVRPGTGLAEAIGALAMQLDRLQAETQIQYQTTHRVGHVLQRNVEQVQQVMAGETPGLMTGLVDIDRRLNGLRGGNAYVLAGRPGMGKTALATSIAVNVARRYLKAPDRAVIPAFFSLEMTADQLGMRVLSDISGLPHTQLWSGALTEQELQLLADYAAQHAELPLIIEDVPDGSLDRLVSRARALVRTEGVGLIIIDYLQRITMKDAKSLYDQNTRASNAIKRLARQTNVPILLLSQLSRAVEQREDKRPRLSDLRDSGAIEEDADAVLFAYRPEYYVEKEKPQTTRNASDAMAEWMERLHAVRGKFLLDLAKYRHGPTGEIDLRFDAERVKVVSAAHEPEPMEAAPAFPYYE